MGSGCDCTIETCTPGQPGQVPYSGFYAADQTHAEGNFGWFVVGLPLTVTRESTLVFAVITEPAENPLRAPPGAVIALDGSNSAMPEGGVALWTIGRESPYLGNPRQQLIRSAGSVIAKSGLDGLEVPVMEGIG